MRLSVLAQGLRVAGGLAVGRNMIAALARVRPNWSYQLFVPADCGYEEIGRAISDVELTAFRHAGRLQRWVALAREEIDRALG